MLPFIRRQRIKSISMDHAPPVCRFVYSSREYARSLRRYRRVSRYRQWWLLIAVLLFLFGEATYRDFRLVESIGAAAAFGIYRGEMLRSYGPFLGLLTVIAFLLSPLARLFFGKRYAFYNQEIVYTFTDEGYLFEAPSIKGNIGWDRVAKAVVLKDGFVLLLGLGRSYVWLPASGFAPESIADFRELVREKVAKTLFR